MKQLRLIRSFCLFFGCFVFSHGQVPENLVTENIPPIPAELKERARPYLESRTAIFQDWHPSRREILITTRFADTMQVHHLSTPLGSRRQLTFFSEPVGAASFHPRTGEGFIFSQDAGGSEFYQLYWRDLKTGRTALLTDGKSRNTGARWSRTGEWLAYTSTRRNGKDNDIYLIDPLKPATNRMVLQVSGGGWQIEDWSLDDKQLLLREYVSINEAYLYLFDLATRSNRLITPKTTEKIAYAQARFTPNKASIYTVTDKNSDFLRLTEIDLATGTHTPLMKSSWDVEDFDVSPDGRTIAVVYNENGTSSLRLLNPRNGRELQAPKLARGVISNLKWHNNGRELAFNMNAAHSPADAFSYDIKSEKLERWTESETGGLDPFGFVQPEVLTVKSFDGLEISAFLYKPNTARFPGPRPVLIYIHGGPESQSRPIFQARNNFLLNELGVALVIPNVRGSAGYGKKFLQLDNGNKREDSVRDIGAVIQAVKKMGGLDGERIGVIGGSYGGYMVLASLVQYSAELRAGIDVVGISNFVTFLLNTQEYRRDLRRAEYGDERDPEMKSFLEQISPANNASKIRKPLFVIQGKNDPRVPLSESEQMVAAIRKNGGAVWYLMARDEGHGFAKKQNADFQFYSTVLFLQKYLVQ